MDTLDRLCVFPCTVSGTGTDFTPVLCKIRKRNVSGDLFDSTPCENVVNLETGQVNVDVVLLVSCIFIRKGWHLRNYFSQKTNRTKQNKRTKNGQGRGVVS